MARAATEGSEIADVVRDGVTRALGAIGLAGMALIHAIDAPGHFTGGADTYLGVMYLGLIVSSLALAGALVVRGDRLTWMAVAALTGTVIVGFVLSRTTGLPGDSSDVGNWGEALGIASLFVEGTLVALSSIVLAAKRSGVGLPRGAENRARAGRGMRMAVAE